MPIRARCWKCGKVVKAGDDWVGKTGKCPSCNAPISFVAEPAQQPPAIPVPQTPSKTSASTAPDELPSVDVHAPRPEAVIPAVAVDSKTGIGRNVVKYWPLVATACVSLLIGYFAGREHLKYEMRKALSSIGESMREAFAPSDGGSAHQPPTLPETAADDKTRSLKIESVDSRVTESNDVWQKHAWILKIHNTGSASCNAEATIEWMDADGFVIDEDTQRGLTIGPGETQTFRGYALIDMPGANNVANVSAKIRY